MNEMKARKKVIRKNGFEKSDKYRLTETLKKRKKQS